MTAPFRIMYHGTNQTYHNKQSEDHGRYQHDRFGQVQLSNEFGDSYSHAIKSAARYWTGDPIVLVIDTYKLDCDVNKAQHGCEWATPYLNPEAYRILTLSGYTDSEKRLAEIIKELTGNS